MSGFLILRGIYWVITLLWGILLFIALWKERDRNTQISAILLLVPVVLRLLFIK